MYISNYIFNKKKFSIVIVALTRARRGIKIYNNRNEIAIIVYNTGPPHKLIVRTLLRI